MSPEKWGKVLWKGQSFQDNHVPSSFLSSLRRNSNFHPYSYWPLVFATCTVVQHLSTISIFLVTFVRIYDGNWDPRILVFISSAVFLLGYVIWDFFPGETGKPQQSIDRAKAMKSAILVFLALMGLSPVLRTLTAATSSDSIWALAACLFIINILLAGYGLGSLSSHPQTRLTSVLSMNAAISSSVVLASRLPDDLSVFALIIYSVQLFSLFPILRTRLRAISFQLPLTAFLAALCINLTMLISIAVTIIIMVVFFLIFFGAPVILVWAQRYKNELRGPWDVAVPRVH